MRRIFVVALLFCAACTGTTTTTTDGTPPPPSPSVPNVVGQNFLEALVANRPGFRLVDFKYRLSLGQPNGTILSQDPKAGTALNPADSHRIRVVVSQRPTRVPRLVGMQLATAKTVMGRHHLKVYVHEVPSTKDAGVVLHQSAQPGEALRPGTTVAITVVSPHVCGSPRNPWCFSVTSGGSLIYSPPFNFCSWLDCISSFWSSTNGYVIQCGDGEFSHSGGVQGSCSSNGGNWRPLYRA
jgi:hypothetical protein